MLTLLSGAGHLCDRTHLSRGFLKRLSVSPCLAFSSIGDLFFRAIFIKLLGYSRHYAQHFAFGGSVTIPFYPSIIVMKFPP